MKELHLMYYQYNFVSIKHVLAKQTADYSTPSDDSHFKRRYTRHT